MVVSKRSHIAQSGGKLVGESLVPLAAVVVYEGLEGEGVSRLESDDLVQDGEGLLPGVFCEEGLDPSSKHRGAFVGPWVVCPPGRCFT